MTKDKYYIKVEKMKYISSVPNNTLKYNKIHQNHQTLSE